MEESINLLKTKFDEIKKKGYVKAVNNNTSGIGLTFEKLIGKEEDNFTFPDFCGIELKTKLKKSITPITLFKMNPDGESFCEAKKIWEKYGYVRAKDKKNKVFYGTMSANEKTKIGLKYQFTLMVNYEEKRLEMHVFDKKNTLFANDSYWSFDKLENALFRKLTYLAVVKTSYIRKKDQFFYKYEDLKIYKLKSFDVFLKLIEKGIITVDFSIDVFKSGKRIGQMHDHGTNFSINENNLNLLFDEMS